MHFRIEGRPVGTATVHALAPAVRMETAVQRSDHVADNVRLHDGPAFASQPGHFHRGCGQSVALQLELRGGHIDPPEVVGGKFDTNRAEVLLQTREFRGARDRDDPRLLGQQPGERDLRGGRLLCATSRSSATSAWFAPARPAAKRGTLARKSELSNRVAASILPVRNPAPSGLKGTKPMPSSSSVGQDLVFGLAPPQRIFALAAPPTAGPHGRAGSSRRRPPKGPNG